VTVRALQHGFSLRAISIDGVDPLADPKAIYDGTYPLGRKIYLLARQPLSENAGKVIEYLLSDQGQKGIENASYLSLPK
jgi:ABC-type phosphate transport system substrate-binding protein